MLIVPSTRRSTFPVAAPRTWNRLPPSIGPQRPYQRFFKNWSHSSSALVTMDIIINLFHPCTFLWPSTHILLTMQSAPAAFSRSVTLIFSFLIIIIINKWLTDWSTYFALDVINNCTALSRTQESIGREILMNRSDRFTPSLRLRKTAERTSTFRAHQSPIVFVFWWMRSMMYVLI